MEFKKTSNNLKDRVTYFAETDFRNKCTPFGIKNKDRSKHMYVIGKTGMGKSTLLENMAVQDIQNGEGLAFLDPHGKSADLLLEYVPEDRIEDVLYFAPFDSDHPISFNIMEDVGYDKRHLVVSGLMSTFKKIWVDAWSARMEYILGNTLLALLEYPESTILGINRMLSDKEYRKKVVENITDSTVKSFWVDEFAKYTDRFAAEATPAIQNKIGQFTANPIIRDIVGQPHSSFDFRDLMDKKKIVIINLAKGRIGELNANLLGSMLITKMYLSAMSRADATEAELENLPDFNLYVDEFQSFANESFADILSEARKYKLSLTIAHQYIAQMTEEVQEAVFGNVGTMISFRVGAYDAEVLEKEFAPTFTSEDMVNLGFAQIYLKLMIDGVSSAPFSSKTLPPIKRPDVSFRDEIVEFSRQKYAAERSHVEKVINEWYKTGSKPEIKARTENRPNSNDKKPNQPPQAPFKGQAKVIFKHPNPNQKSGYVKNAQPRKNEGMSDKVFNKPTEIKSDERPSFNKKDTYVSGSQSVQSNPKKENPSRDNRAPSLKNSTDHRSDLRNILSTLKEREKNKEKKASSSNEENQQDKKNKKQENSKKDNDSKQNKNETKEKKVIDEIPESELRRILDVDDGGDK